MSRLHRDQKVTFLSPPTGQDTYGGMSGTWSTYLADIWASVEPILGNEYFSARAIQTDAKIKVNCQYISGVTDLMRIQHGSELYQILDSINVKSLNRDLLCYCKKVST